MKIENVNKLMLLYDSASCYHLNQQLYESVGMRENREGGKQTGETDEKADELKGDEARIRERRIGKVNISVGVGSCMNM